MRYRNYNPNPITARVGDCVIRAIACATGETWENVYINLCLYGLLSYDLPSANNVWGKYLHDKGFTRHILPDTCPDCYTVDRFAKEHPDGVYILSLNGHVVCVKNGQYWDTWDSGQEIAVYYWKEGV